MNLKITLPPSKKRTTISLDSDVHEQIEYYCQLLSEQSGEEVNQGLVISEMLRSHLRTEKDFQKLFKKHQKDGAAKTSASAAEVTPASALSSFDSTNSESL